MNEPRNGEYVVNTHTGVDKPDGEPFNENSHGHRCYHGDDVGTAIEHWGTFNGRGGDKRTSLELVEALVPKVGNVFEVFHIDRYVAVTFAGTPATIETYISTGFVETRTKVLIDQVKTQESYWRLELSGLGGNSSSAATRSAIRESECPCSPGMKVPVGSSCPTCEEPCECRLKARTSCVDLHCVSRSGTYPIGSVRMIMRATSYRAMSQYANEAASV